MSIWRWHEHLREVPPEHRITLGEGETPIVRSRRIGPAAGIENLYFKLEGVNPTGSYKDRFAAAAVSDMLSAGKDLCIATSSGNTGAALAAYCAAAGVQCDIAVVETAPAAKLRQMMVYGARVFKVRGFGTDGDMTERTFEHIRQRASHPRAALQISAFRYSPIGMTGVETIAFELVEQMRDGIADVFVPAGGGGLTVAVARGLERMKSEGRLRKMPHIHCVQPHGNNTIAGSLIAGEERAQAVQCTTAISGLQVPSIVDGDEVISRVRTSGGTGHLVTDEQVWTMQERLALEEGIFCEPAAAVSVAAAHEAIVRGEIAPAAPAVCLITSVGFKDAPSVDRMLATKHCPLMNLQDLR